MISCRPRRARHGGPHQPDPAFATVPHSAVAEPPRRVRAGPQGGRRVTTMTLLTVDQPVDLVPHGHGLLRAVTDVSFELDRGRTLGLVGESGSGKSVLTRSVIGIQPPCSIGPIRAAGSWFDGLDLTAMSDAHLRQVWQRRISIVPQNPLSSLNPVLRVGTQLGEVLQRFKRGVDGKRGGSALAELLEQVGIPDPARRLALVPARAVRRHAPARRRSPWRSRASPTCWSPTNPRPRSTSPCRHRSWACCAAMQRARHGDDLRQPRPRRRRWVGRRDRGDVRRPDRREGVRAEARWSRTPDAVLGGVDAVEPHARPAASTPSWRSIPGRPANPLRRPAGCSFRAALPRRTRSLLATAAPPLDERRVDDQFACWNPVPTPWPVAGRCTCATTPECVAGRRRPGRRLQRPAAARRCPAVADVSFDVLAARRWVWWASPGAASRPPATPSTS